MYQERSGNISSETLQEVAKKGEEKLQQDFNQFMDQYEPADQLYMKQLMFRRYATKEG